MKLTANLTEAEFTALTELADTMLEQMRKLDSASLGNSPVFAAVRQVAVMAVHALVNRNHSDAQLVLVLAVSCDATVAEAIRTAVPR